MFKQALSGLAQGIISSSKEAVSEYLPGSGKLGTAFERVSQQGIANLAHRSPVLADVATSVIEGFKKELEKKQTFQNYAKSSSAASIRSVVAERMGKDQESSEVSKETAKILSQMSSLLSKKGEASKEDQLFKDFGTEFEKFSESLRAKKDPTTEPPAKESTEILDKIDTNTRKTVEILADMSESGIPGAPQGVVEPGVKSPSTFVDPVTGMPSIQAAIGTIGGSFLAKVFDEDTLSKFANKVKSRFDPASQESFVQQEKKTTPEDTVDAPKAKVRKVDHSNNIKDILKDLSLDLGPSKGDKESLIEAEVTDKKKSASAQGIQTQILDELKTLNGKSKDEKGGVFSDLIKSFGGITSMLGGLTTKLGPMIASAASALGPAAAVAGAGAAGYTLGSTVVAPLIDKGISAATGRENSLGGWLADTFQDDPNAIWEKQNKERLAARKNTAPSAVQSEVDQKSAAAAKTAASPPPIIVQAPSVQSGGNSTTIIAQSNVRNRESTFERVQSRDYWSK